MNVWGFFALWFLLCLSLPALAQPSANLPAQRPGAPFAAVVNDDVITQRDVEQRTRLTLLTSNLEDTPDMRSRIAGPLLRRLIDEDLKIQAAIKQKIVVTADDITAQIDAIEQQNHLPPGGLIKLLASKGIEPDAIRQQLRAEIAWASLVRHIFSREVHVSESAVTTRLDAIRANLGKPEYRASEIFLAIDDPKDEPEVRDLAERLSEQISRGAPFNAIAQQFSQAAATEGNLGWLSDGMLDDELLTALAALKPGQATKPIRTTDGYHILMLLEQRKVGEGLGNGPYIDLMTIELSSLPGAKPAEREMQRQRLLEILAPARNCDELSENGKAAPAASFTLAAKLPESQIPTKVLAMIKDLAPGKISEPMDVPKGRRFFAVCGRGSGNESGLPSADDIRHRMEDEQLALVVRRHLLNLHRGAVIDIR